MWLKINSVSLPVTVILMISLGLSACSSTQTSQEKAGGAEADRLLREVLLLQLREDENEQLGSSYEDDAGIPTDGELSLSVKQKPTCSISGVLLSGSNEDRLIIGLGQRPTAGFSMMLADQVIKNGEISISYEEVKPDGDTAVAQVMTSPCMIVGLPEVWSGLRVTEAATGQSVYFKR